MHLKIGVFNGSGNVGKTTISRRILVPRLSNPLYLPIESHNADDSGPEVEALRSNDFRRVMQALVLPQSAVVDVGSSNLEDFFSRMEKYEGSHENFDVFLVPTIPRKKQILDTAATIDSLSSLGVSQEKIRVIFNLIDENTDDIETEFSYLLTSKSCKGKFTYEPIVQIHESDLYPLLGDDSIESVVSDSTDYKRAIQNTQDPAERFRLLDLQMRQQLARKVKREHDQAFSLLFPSLTAERAA